MQEKANHSTNSFELTDKIFALVLNTRITHELSKFRFQIRQTQLNAFSFSIVKYLFIITSIVKC